MTYHVGVPTPFAAMTRVAPLFFLLSIAVAGCGSGNMLAEGGDSSVITRADVDAAVNAPNARVLVERLRPGWLYVRGGGVSGNLRTAGDSQGGVDAERVSVYVNGSRRGTSETLASIARVEIETLQYYNPAQANVRFGATNGLGAISVVLREDP